MPLFWGSGLLRHLTCCLLPSADYVPRQDYEALGLEVASLKEQLVQCLEELASREREAAELSDANSRWAQACLRLLLAAGS